MFAHQRKLRPIFFADRIGRGKSELLEILILAALHDPEIQMRSGGKSGASDQPDGFADFDVLAGPHVHSRQMQIHGLVPIGMRDLHHVAFAALAAGKNHAATADRLDGRADRRAVIGAHVRPIAFQDRVKSRFAEMRCDRRAEFQRRAEKRFLQRLAVRGVVARPPGLVVK
jgi:hypothetical protein